MTSPKLLRAAIIAGFAASALSASQAFAIAIGVNNSNYTATHDGDFGAGAHVVHVQNPIDPWPPAIDFVSNQSLNATNTSFAAGGAATYVSPNLVGLGIAGGTGISQDWLDADPHTAASLRIDFSVNYQTDVGGFSPPTYSFANLGLVGNVSNGGFVRFTYGAQFVGTDGVLGGPLGGVYFNNTPGVFAVPIFEFHWNNGFTGPNGTIQLNGFLLFEAFDGENHSHSGIEFAETSGIGPVPVPAALPLMAAGIGALVVIGRRRSA